jgi:Mrp family chromosome partitioning ATPase
MTSSTVLAHAASINRLLGRLAEAYDLVIIDGNRLSHKNPRLIGTGDQAMLDAALVIVDAELSLRQRVDSAVELLRLQGIQAIGMAENFHSEAKA